MKNTKAFTLGRAVLAAASTAVAAPAFGQMTLVEPTLVNCDEAPNVASCAFRWDVMGAANWSDADFIAFVTKNFVEAQDGPVSPYILSLGGGFTPGDAWVLGWEPTLSTAYSYQSWDGSVANLDGSGPGGEIIGLVEPMVADASLVIETQGGGKNQKIFASIRDNKPNDPVDANYALYGAHIDCVGFFPSSGASQPGVVLCSHDAWYDDGGVLKNGFNRVELPFSPHHAKALGIPGPNPVGSIAGTTSICDLVNGVNAAFSANDIPTRQFVANSLVSIPGGFVIPCNSWTLDASAGTVIEQQAIATGCQPGSGEPGTCNDENAPGRSGGPSEPPISSARYDPNSTCQLNSGGTANKTEPCEETTEEDVMNCLLFGTC